MIITQTPLRISFVGGGTDLPSFYRKYEGEVLSTAIDKYVYVIVKERYDSDIYINYSKKEIVKSVGDIEHDLVREAMNKLDIEGGIEITFLADIPSHGSGLGSSSSVTVGLLNALYAYKGMIVDAERLAREACEIEIDILRHPIGKQDQYIAAYGNLRHIRFRSDESVEIEPVTLGERSRRYLANSLLLFYTGQSRKAASILQEQQESIHERISYYHDLKRLVPRAMAVLHDMNQQVPTREMIEEFGRTLHAGWELKKNFASNVTNPQIDAMYEAAIRAGALGGKLLGAGGGGFLLFVVLPEKQEDVRYALQYLQEFPFDFVRDGSKTIFNIRRA